MLQTNLDFLCTRNDEEVIALCQNPCKRGLSRCRIVLLPNLANARSEAQELGQIVCCEFGHRAPEIVGLKVIDGADLAGQEATAKGRVCNDFGAQGASGLHELERGLLDVEHDGGELDLECGDGVDGMCATEAGGGAVRKAEVFYFSCSVESQLELGKY
jgi:hypothetical protein